MKIWLVCSLRSCLQSNQISAELHLLLAQREGGAKNRIKQGCWPFQTSPLAVVPRFSHAPPGPETKNDSIHSLTHALELRDQHGARVFGKSLRPRTCAGVHSGKSQHYPYAFERTPAHARASSYTPKQPDSPSLVAFRGCGMRLKDRWQLWHL